MTRAAYARHRGVSKEAVSKAIRQGRIQADARGLIDSVAADQAWAESTRPRAHGPLGSSLSIEGISLTDARTLHELAKARLAELELGERMGELVQSATVRDQAFRAARAARDILESIPDRIADTLVGLTDGDEIRKLLRSEIENALDALASARDLPEPDEGAA